VPYFAAGAYILGIGTPGPSLADMGNGIAAGDLYSRMLPLAIPFGILGSLLLLKVRRPLPLFTGAFVFVCLALASSTYLHLFGSEIAERANKQMVFPRFFMLAKPFWYAAGAWLLVRGLAAVYRMVVAERVGSNGASRARALPMLTRAAVLIFFAVLVAPLLSQAGRAFIRNEVLRTTAWHSQREDRAARVAFLEWAPVEFANTPGFFRITHGLGEDGHRLSDPRLSSLSVLQGVVHADRSLQTQHRRFLDRGPPRRERPLRALRRAARPRRPQMITMSPPKLNVYRFTEWNPDPFVVSQGTGESSSSRSAVRRSRSERPRARPEFFVSTSPISRSGRRRLTICRCRSRLRLMRTSSAPPSWKCRCGRGLTGFAT
jgi:hypothetical protein